VKVVRADGVTGVPGVHVNLTGPSNQDDVTNSQGCVVWGALPAGNGYTVAVDERASSTCRASRRTAARPVVVQDSLSNDDVAL
jgi:hypothetical protein